MVEAWGSFLQPRGKYAIRVNISNLLKIPYKYKKAFESFRRPDIIP